MKKIDEEIKELNSDIAYNLSKGILKASLLALPFILSLSSIGAGIWGAVQSKQCKKEYNSLKGDESYLAVQAEDIATLNNQQKNGEINALQYKDALEYIQGNEYFENYMSANDDNFQNLLKQKKTFDYLEIGGIVAGFFGVLASFILEGFLWAEDLIELDEFRQAKYYIERKKPLTQLKKREKLDEGNSSNEKIEDLEDEFYKKD